jgi:NAD(P)-dependent dehydrogenase (short-subunit alcohol dehydrogenase family)
MPRLVQDEDAGGEGVQLLQEGRQLFYTIKLAIDFAKKGRRINAVCPGMTSTPIIDDFIAVVGEERVERIQSLVGGWADPTDIA